MLVQPTIPDAIRWFADARFGMFVHFGLYALVGRGEWVMYNENIPRAEYEKLANQFNPHRFDAKEWVALAQDAGARYITVTAKHHDGFCLFDSALTDWKITNTPFRRDLIGELVDACHARDMRIIFYYSQPDWHHPNFVHQPGAFKDLNPPPKNGTPDWDRYVEYYIGQVRELCTNYGRIDGIWFDGSHKTEKQWRGREVYETIKTLQPTAVVNDRARYGDFFAPERHLPEDLTGYLFEACESISPTSWGYQGDTASHSAPYLIQSLVKMATAGGNYLLNVGPAPDGTIPSVQAERMRLIGAWLAKFGEAIFGTAAGPAFTDSTLRATRRDRTVYLHLLDWPATDRITLPGAVDVRTATLLPEESPVDVITTPDGIELRNLPALPPDSSVNVIRLDLANVPETWKRHPVEPESKPAVRVRRDGETILNANEAELRGLGVKGARLRIMEHDGRRYIDYWMVPEHEAVWNVDVESEGVYDVALTVWYRTITSGCSVAIRTERQSLSVQIPEGGTSDEFRTYRAGSLSLNRGQTRITVAPDQLKWGYLLVGIEKLALRRRA